MSRAYEIFDAAFAKPRDPRSDEYRHGVIDILKHRLGEANEESGKYQYVIGTAQADAYYAGCDEGHRLAREHLGKVGAGRTVPNVELTGSRAGLSPVSPATEGSEVERRVGGQAHLTGSL